VTASTINAAPITIDRMRNMAGHSYGFPAEHGTQSGVYAPARRLS
jgi:hypothetical protein